MTSQQSPGALPPEPKHGPYLPTTWSLGGIPTVKEDIPITAVFLLLFILGAVIHMTILQLNLKRGHKFLFSGAIFGFCMARIVTCIMRIASIALPRDANLSIAALVFTNAGVVILYIVNLLFAQRLLRAQHPHIGWSRPVSYAFRALYILVIVTITMIIIVVVQSLFTLSTNTHRIDRDIQLTGITTFAVIAFLPILITALVIAIPRRPKGRRPDKFGHGRWREKIRILLLASVLLCFGTCYKAASLWKKPVPRTEPMPKEFNKAAFYIANFTVEILVVYLYAVVRVDLRFWVPNGASKRRHFRVPEKEGEGQENGNVAAVDEQMAPVTSSSTKTDPADLEKEDQPMSRVFSEEETFDENEEGRIVEGDIGVEKRMEDVETGRAI